MSPRTSFALHTHTYQSSTFQNYLQIQRNNSNIVPMYAHLKVTIRIKPCTAVPWSGMPSKQSIAHYTIRRDAMRCDYADESNVKGIKVRKCTEIFSYGGIRRRQ